jgi:hypothetical protein
MAIIPVNLQTSIPYIDTVITELKPGDQIVFINGNFEKFTVIIENANTKFHTNKDTYFYDIEGGYSATTDPARSLDSQFNYFVYFHDTRNNNVFNSDAPPRIILHKQAD